MLENLSFILGLIATVFGITMSLGYVSQIIKMIKRKSSADVSVTTYLMFTVGMCSWLLYGISLNDLPLIISNIIAITGSISVIITYFHYKK